MTAQSIEQTVETTAVAPYFDDLAEIAAYAGPARRGDVLPVCMRLTATRADAEWTLRTHLVRQVGPTCPQTALDRAVELMPDAPEPRLLRAGRSLAIAARTGDSIAQRAWLAFARDDLLVAARLAAMDPTARGMLADLVGASAWAAIAA